MWFNGPPCLLPGILWPEQKPTYTYNFNFLLVEAEETAQPITESSIPLKDTGLHSIIDPTTDYLISSM